MMRRAVSIRRSCRNSCGNPHSFFGITPHPVFLEILDVPVANNVAQQAAICGRSVHVDDGGVIEGPVLFFKVPDDFIHHDVCSGWVQ
jgi:hypothetical protein